MPAKNGKLIVHMVGNAHLDPAWLWTWPAGVDEALATCRTACDLLDENADLHITRGEAWVHYQVQRLDPPLFQRIVGHVAGGRWHVVNGWWVQPDCNQPSPESFRKQAEIGGRFLREHLGIEVTVGYNVDSFGHCGMLPTFLRQSGRDAYVFMRPGPHENPLPANLFRWRSPAGDEVLTFRIARSYGTAGASDLKTNVEAAIAAANRKTGHTMCFYGVGDHGGGPTREQIDWIREHKAFAADVELRFSHARTFFDAVKPYARTLPVVVGELQYHAVGCYAAVRDLKRETRRAEAMLLQAEALAAAAGADADPAIANGLEAAWRNLLFNQFHDILGGSSIKIACIHALEELGQVKSFARELAVAFTRKANVRLPPCPRQRVILDNPGDTPWAGYAEFEPWLQNGDARKRFSLVTEDGTPVPAQIIGAECAAGLVPRLLFPVAVPAAGRRVLEVRCLPQPPTPPPSDLRSDGQTLACRNLSVTCNSTGMGALVLGGRNLLGTESIRVCIFEDKSDTWSHDIAGYEGPCLATFAAATPWTVRENGPLRSSLTNALEAQNCSLLWTVQLLKGQNAVRMRLRLTWQGRDRIVKLIVPTGFRARIRRDGTPGAIITRPFDGHEYPVRDLLSVAGENDCLTAVSPDVFSADVRPDGTMRLTLLRCPLYAHHDPYVVTGLNPYPVTDQGVHEFEIVLIPGTEFGEDAIQAEAYRLLNPLWISETTKGMPSGWRHDRLPEPLAPGALPMPPSDALVADDLVNLTAARTPATLVASGTLCTTWPGERLLLSTGPALALRLSLPADARYRLAVARLTGSGYGDTDVCLAGKAIGRLTAKGKAVVPAVDVVSKTVVLPAGDTTLEFRARNGTRMAIGFVHICPLYADVPANAWLAVGPFRFGREADGAKALADVENVVRHQSFPPETTRDFTAPVALGDGTTARWQKLAGAGTHVDLHALTGAMRGSLHYAATRIWSPRRCRAWLAYGMDYWLRIWVNHRPVLEFAAGDGLPRPRQFTHDVELNQGWNDVLVKVASGSGGNGFWLAIADAGEFRFARPKQTQEGHE